MHSDYGRNLDLNLLRVFAVVAGCGSVTEAASRLYLTQPAVSAALRRLRDAVGDELLVRRGRGIALTERGRVLQQALEPHLTALVNAALEPAGFDPQRSQRTLRIGFSDAAELWLLPRLLRHFARHAPLLRVVSVPVQFRTVGALLSAGLDLAVSVADELPENVHRRELLHGGFVCVFDQRHLALRRLTEAAYFACDHVIVSYNGDLRGIVEDATGKARRVRCSVASFANLGAVLIGSKLMATVPALVAAQLVATHPGL